MSLKKKKTTAAKLKASKLKTSKSQSSKLKSAKKKRATAKNKNTKISKKNVKKKKAIQQKGAGASVKKTSISNQGSKVMSSASLINQVIQSFQLPMTGGQAFDSANLKGKKIVLYFYPKDATPGCTIEGHEFSKLKNEFLALNTVVLGVSRDSIESHEKFKAKQNYSIDLLSDADEKLCKMFDVIKPKNMYGKMVVGIQRSTFVLDESHKLVYEWRAVKAEGHAQEVLNFVKQLP